MIISVKALWKTLKTRVRQKFKIELNMNSVNRVTRIILSLVFLNALVACSGSDNNQAAVNTTTTEIPAELQKLTLGTGTLRAFVTVDGDTAGRTEMTIDTSGSGTASVSIPGLSLAMHTITITYEYTDTFGTVVLATATQTVDLTSGSGSINFVESDYDLASYDDDGDGFNNAIEVATGSDPTVPTSVPPPGSINCVLDTSTLDNCTLG